MTSKMHFVSQVLLMVTHAANLFSGIIPQKYQPIGVFVIGVAQLGLALYNHYFNPDGTPAAQTWKQ